MRAGQTRAQKNLMARENLRYAVQTVESLRDTNPDAYSALLHKTTLEPTEIDAWRRAAESMYVPYDEKLKILPQDDGFLEREPWDFRNTPPDHYPVLLFYRLYSAAARSVAKCANHQCDRAVA